MKKLVSLLALGVSLFTANFCLASSEEEAFAAGVDAYIFGYPLVLMDVTKEVATNVAVPDNYHAPINQFAHSQELPGANFRLFPSPNVDMLPSFAWLDLTNSGYVLHLPTIPTRYFVVELIDGWSNVITSFGPRTTGSNVQDVLITGPNFKDEVPQNMTQIQSSTNMLWVVVRTQCYNPQDVPIVKLLQNQFKLTPLASYEQYYAPPQNVAVNTAIEMKRPPVEQIAMMDATAFFKRLAKLMKQNPPAAQDAPLLAQLATLGIVPGKEPVFDDATIRGLKRAQMAGLTKILAQIDQVSKVLTGWSTPFTQVGQYGTNYLLRAYVANAALGANLPQDILGIICEVDVNGQTLDGNKSYRIHANASQVPPCNAFWSLTMYNKDHYLVSNSQNRYVLHSFTTLAYDTLQYNTDGSLDIILQQEKPDTLATNWLPTPSGTFTLALRLYWPGSGALSGAYLPPPVVKDKG